MSLQGEIVYVIFWIVMLIVPIIAGIRRYWAAAVIYLIGSLLFAVNLFKDKGGWDDLANFATLLVIVLPIYLVGTAVWIWSVQRRKRSK
jgi:peptidoglycan/LPS O-acetylase OafA/YrhL